MMQSLSFSARRRMFARGTLVGFPLLFNRIRRRRAICKANRERSKKKRRLAMQVVFSFWSGLRGSNSLPPPWQGGALPDELSPRNESYITKGSCFCQEFLKNFQKSLNCRCCQSREILSKTAKAADQIQRKNNSRGRPNDRQPLAFGAADGSRTHLCSLGNIVMIISPSPQFS